MHDKAAYNQVIKDLADTISDLQTNTIYAASRMHLMNTDTGTLKEMEDSNSSILFNMQELVENNDERIARIMQTYKKAEEIFERLRGYWMTTPEWANGEEL